MKDKSDKRACFLVLKVSISSLTMTETLAEVGRWIVSGDQHYMSICTTHTILECCDDSRMAEIVNGAGLATPDGKPLTWIGRMRGCQVNQVCGPELLPALCDYGQSRGYRHYFYGATDAVLDAMIRDLKKQFPDLIVAGVYSPPFRSLSDEEKQADINRINDSEADIVWCGLGTPKQDFWVSENCGKVSASALIPVGAAFNFHAGEIQRAPRWMIACGLEWLYRLLVEPRRLWRRYLIGNTRFIFLCLKDFFATRGSHV